MSKYQPETSSDEEETLVQPEEREQEVDANVDEKDVNDSNVDEEDANVNEDDDEGSITTKPIVPQPSFKDERMLPRSSTGRTRWKPQKLDL